MYRTPTEMYEDIKREVVQRTESAGTRALNWGAEEIGGHDTPRRVWLHMKNNRRLRG